jgi:hypothetical protein
LFLLIYFLFPVIRDTAALRFPFHAPYLAVLLRILITNNIGFSLPALWLSSKHILLLSLLVLAYTLLLQQGATFAAIRALTATIVALN